MAKKKISQEIDDSTDVGAAKKHLISKYGNIMEKGSKVLSDLMELKVISFSPALDIALGGGLREGNVVIMTGDPKSGKTTSALYFAAKCQKLGKNVIYFNTEGRITKENFVGIKDLNPEAIEIVQPTDEQPIVSAETYLNTLEYCVKNIPDLVCIVDSASNMVPQEELEGEVRTGVRNALPRLLSMFFKRISGDVARNKAIMIFITHNITNTAPASKYSPSKVADCGVMIQYQAGTNMVITHRGKWEVPKESGNHVGQVANWIIKTSAAGGKPNSTAESWIKYGIGIDEAQEIAQIATQFNFIKAKGSWYDIDAVKTHLNDPRIASILQSNNINPSNEEEVDKFFKFQGMQKVTDFLTENEGLKDFLYEKIKEIL